MREQTPRLGLTAWIINTSEEEWDAELERAQAAGAELIELRLAYPPGNGALRGRQLRRIKHHLRTDLIVHAPATWESLITLHTGLREASLKELQETLQVAAELGAEGLILTGGPLHFPVEREPLKDSLQAALEELLPQAQEQGIKLILRNRADGYPAEAAELEAALIPGVEAGLDLGELPAANWITALEGLLARLAVLRLPARHATEAELLAYLRGTGFAGDITLYDAPGKPLDEALSALRTALRKT